ncbi:hypothetical protein CPC08DRAFT_815978 [Agrocybe pediades]|nr:hypothetical protein CPC08DRAFT_815978 [Agrocybe pediades]
MKRSSSLGSSNSKSSKRNKLNDDDSFYLVQEQSITDMMQQGVDETKCITGKFKMMWDITPQAEQISTIVTVQSDSQEAIFPIDFQLAKHHLASLHFLPYDEFRLSLRGALLLPAEPNPRICNKTFKLVYKKGVQIQWKQRGASSGKYINTWADTGIKTSESDDWFSEEAAGPSAEAAPKADVSMSNMVDAPDATNSAQAATDHPASKTSKRNKKEERMEAKRLKREAAARQAHCTRTATNSQASEIDGVGSSFVANVEVTAPRSSGLSTNSQPAFHGSNVYRPFYYLSKGQTVHLCGIVVGMSDPRQSVKGDWMRYIQIVDPRSPNGENLADSRPLKINCFTRRYKEWLPHPKLYDCLILRNVKVDEFNGAPTGTGYHDRLTWAAFSPSKGDIHYGPKNQAPKEDVAGSGFGAKICPYFTPESEDIQHCIWLSDWWRSVHKGSADSQVPNPIRTGLTGRKHRLLRDTGPNVHPDGYFDCTIEVLRLFTDDMGGCHTLYATDYTKSDQMHGTSGRWPPSLNDYVMRFAMWDEAAKFAEQNMRPGLYFSINNARMKLDNASCLEAKVVQAKIVQLDESDAAKNIHLKALLERKQIWEATHQASSTSDINYRLLQDVEEGKFFHCTAELLYASSKPNELPYVYVTDYTINRGLPTSTIGGSWSRGLEGRILRIWLSEDQTHVAESPSIGSFYAFKKLRLKRNTVENELCASLGGAEKLVIMLNPDKTHNEHLNGLLRRREDWMRNRHSVRQQVIPTLSPLPAPLADQTEGKPLRCLRQMPLAKGQGALRHHIIAKVVDFHPLELRDAFYQLCTKCNKQIPGNQKACVKCADFDHEFVQYCFEMFLKIEDEDGDQIMVSMSNECPLFNGLKRAHLREDYRALHAFSDTVLPLVDELVPMHECLKAGKPTSQPNSRFFRFELHNWVLPDGGQGFSLHRYDTNES